MSDDLSDPRAFRWVEAGISGIPRAREWDVVITTTCRASGNRQMFMHPWPQRAETEEGDAHDVIGCAIRALEEVIEPPYRAEAIRKDGDTWAIGAVRVEVAEFPADIEGDELLFTVTDGGERELVVDGQPTPVGLDGLSWLIGDRYESYVLRARRIEGVFWEMTVDPL